MVTFRVKEWIYDFKSAPKGGVDDIRYSYNHKYDYLQDQIRESFFLASLELREKYLDIFQNVDKIKKDPERQVCRHNQHVTPIERRGNFNNGRKKVS